MRGYSYKNLIELGIAKYLIETIGLQVYLVKKFLDEIREDGDLEIWATDYSQHCISIAYKAENQKKEDLGGFHSIFRVNDPHGLGGTLTAIPQKIKKSKSPKGTLYYFYVDFQSEKKKTYLETIRIITPWDLSNTLKIFQHIDLDIKEILAGKGLIAINLGRIKEEVDRGIEHLEIA